MKTEAFKETAMPMGQIFPVKESDTSRFPRI